ncbi:hypothetical protein EJ02DRAFT_57588 [Clathrospora elynae]|uniref:Zn(2)-C6 fungal-type domain-containing protein n=1 Tax=Clathrospora elynae TaxID=706981 RepID=A0A6A5SFU8_9PLEO|nr:hypothetical protein EJ02DRAFT_57588 [Clathrospora elynae]
MDGHAQPANICDAHDGALWPKQPVQLARGRQPRDALAKTMAYYVSSMDAFETSLREYLESPPEQPEHTEAHVSFWIGTSFMVSAPLSKLNASPPQPQPHFVHQYAHPPPGFPAANVLPAQYGGMSHVYPASDPSTVLAQSIEPNDAGSHTASKKVQHKVSLSIMDALQPTAEPKEKMRKQRAIAKCCVESIQRIDGYRYSFHNCWNSREDDSFRFSYYCNDSLLNKDRAANGKGAKLGKRATKPVYDCKGVLSIKFSASKQTLDVFYKHIPVHKTYEERAPAPRKDSKRRRFLEAHDPDALARLASRPRQLSSEDPDTPKTKKNKSKPPTDAPRASNTSLESDLRAQSLRSLLELIQVDPPASVQSAPPEPPPPPPPPQPPSQYIAPAPRPLVLHVQVPPTPTQQRRRPRNSCDVCKAKKTKCDGTRPICKTCGDRKRKCFYSELTAGGEQCQSEVNEPARQAHAANNELSELAKMKRELEEAKARIQELETEKRASSTPIQTPQMSSRPLSRPLSQPQAQLQPQRRPQISQAHTQSHIAQQQQQQPQRQQAPSNHRQQLQQLNQGT